MNRGKFVTLEGTEGSGKTLQIEKICAQLDRIGVNHIRTFEPGGTDFGKEVREVLLSSKGARREPVSELLLYLADRYQHLREKVDPALENGLLVISDRYHDATLAYQAFARDIGFELVNRLSAVLGIRMPDLTLVLDISPEVGLQRARERNLQEGSSLGRFEEEEIHFHNRVREGYRYLALEHPRRIRLIDASGEPDEVFERIWQEFSEIL